jgi:uncharacterized protein YegP (UPF0339 family)
MTKRGIRFKAWQSEKDGQFYAHMIAGNNKTTWTSEGYPEVRIAFKNIDSTWKAIGAALGVAEDEMPPMGWTKDSLMPVPASTAQVRTIRISGGRATLRQR